MACSMSCRATRERSTRSCSIRVIAAVSFVGSTPIAQYIQSQGVLHGKRVQALGGAKNHAVVMPDADLDAATEAIARRLWFGWRRCMAFQFVVAVGQGTADGLIARLHKRVAALKVGAPEAAARTWDPW